MLRVPFSFLRNEDIQGKFGRFSNLTVSNMYKISQRRGSWNITKYTRIITIFKYKL